MARYTLVKSNLLYKKKKKKKRKEKINCLYKINFHYPYKNFKNSLVLNCSPNQNEKIVRKFILDTIIYWFFYSYQIHKHLYEFLQEAKEKLFG